ncbi:MAG TPA: 23S rRNA (adenine(2503)-C(2))-methyltransferase RlmN [Candidatus Eisenbacteria bacterium]
MLRSGAMDTSPALRPILDRTLPELRSELVELGIEGWRADQIYTWVYRKGVADFEAMTDIARATRERLAATYRIDVLVPKDERTASDRSATKCLFPLADGREIEGVFLRLPTKETICFSTQVGCAIGCGFCVTALMGRLRNLAPGEIVGQILHLSRRFVEREQGFNLVAMGMGEPFDNYDNLLTAVRIMKEVRGLNIGPRRITISTSGLVPMIDRLATEGIPLGLAVSLNATTDEQRSEIMPINRKYPIEELLAAAGRYAKATSRRVTLEYVLLKGVNDSEADARRLIKLSSRLPSKINLIPFNPSPYHSYAPPSPESAERFRQILIAADKTATIRRRRGGDIYAACGQLGVTQAR